MFANMRSEGSLLDSFAASQWWPNRKYFFALDPACGLRRKIFSFAFQQHVLKLEEISSKSPCINENSQRKQKQTLNLFFVILEGLT
jgi:hypothetical protein